MRLPGYKPGAVQQLGRGSVQGELAVGRARANALGIVGDVFQDQAAHMAKRQSDMEERRAGLTMQSDIAQINGDTGGKEYFTAHEIDVINKAYNIDVQMPEGKDRIESYLVRPEMFKKFTDARIKKISEGMTFPHEREIWIDRMKGVAGAQHEQIVRIGQGQQLRLQTQEGAQQYEYAVKNQNWELARQLARTLPNASDMERALAAKQVDFKEEESVVHDAIARQDGDEIDRLLAIYKEEDAEGRSIYAGAFNDPQRKMMVLQLESRRNQLLAAKGASDAHIRKQQIVYVRETIKAIRVGGKIDATIMKQVQDITTGINDPQLTSDLQKAVTLMPWRDRLLAIPLAAREMETQLIKKELIESGDPYMINLSHSIEELLHSISSFERSDQVAALTVAGTIPDTPTVRISHDNTTKNVDGNTPRQIGQQALVERKKAVDLGVQMGRARVYFTNDEIDQLKTDLENATDMGKLDIFASLFEVLGSEATAVFDQMGQSKNAGKWWIVGKLYMNGREGPALAKRVLQGYELMKKNQELLPKGKWKDKVNNLVGAMRMPSGDYRAALIQAAGALYVMDNDNISSGSYSSDVMKASVDALLGHTVKTPYHSGMLSGWTAGDDRLESPHNVDNDTYTEFLKTYGPDYIDAMGGALTKDGNRYDSKAMWEDIQDGSLIMKNGGHGRVYIVRETGGADQGLVNAKTNRPFFIEYDEDTLARLSRNKIERHISDNPMLTGGL